MSSANSFSDHKRRVMSPEWLFWAPPLLVAAMIAALYVYGPISQPLSYHDFADQRMIGGVPHGADVWSNLGFALVGLWGLIRLFSQRHHPQLRQGWPGYALFLLALIGTAIGSALYHWAPDNIRLIWDRLPIALACAGLLAAVRCETLCSGEGWAAAAALGIVAAASVAWWYITGVCGQDDLRPYLLLQCLPLVLIPLWQRAHRALVADQKAFLWAIGFYFLAKVAELGDSMLFDSLHVVSGHTLKHLFATLAAAVIVWRLGERVKKRSGGSFPLNKEQAFRII
ncbi:MAG: alkaline phytoceramidase [Proteobacteria bacterium]|nr:alkaline phytoceramidase [Pseudomonadota bacterium]